MAKSHGQSGNTRCHCVKEWFKGQPLSGADLEWAVFERMNYSQGYRLLHYYPTYDDIKTSAIGEKPFWQLTNALWTIFSSAAATGAVRTTAMNRIVLDMPIKTVW